nr:histidinol-phosphatase HisJ family protein [candidate division Zixibacteria bacterium]
MHKDHYALADYHVHPDFSFDAQGTLAEHCEAARKRGIAEICFTSHYDTNPVLSEKTRQIRVAGEMLPTTVENFRHYVEAVAHIGAESPMVIKCGVEAGYYPGCEEEISRLFKTYRFDYKLGAVHEVGDFNICNPNHFEDGHKELPLGSLLDRYFEVVDRAVESRLFDVIAHLDMYKWYGLKYYGEDLLTAHRGRIEPILEKMADYNIGIEINTAAVRKGHKEYYPSMDIVNLARAAGVRIAAIGSDAHKPDEIGYDFDGAMAIAYELFPYCNE